MTDNVIGIDAAKAKGARKARNPERQTTGDWRDAIVYTREGAIDGTVANVITVLGNDDAWVDIFQFDEFSQAVATSRVPPWDATDAPAMTRAGEWSDSDVVRTQAWLARHYQIKVGRDTVWDAVHVLSEKKTINPPKDWLQGLRWDGTRRVDTWLVSYLGAASSPYVASVGRWMLISGVARIMQPGCKVDTMLVLEGPQGLKKSTSMRVLFSDKWFSDTPLDLNSKDRFVGLRHNWCHEFAELDAFGRAEIARVKSFLSSQTDDFRPPYGRSNVKVDRRCIFVGTVNDSEYLRDPTGNRRFWPVRCGRIDIPALERDREQLMAEAREMFADGERWWPEGDEVGRCEEAQAERASHDAWEATIETYVEKMRLSMGADAFVTVGDILGNAIGLEKSKWGQSEQNRVAKCLLQLKWETSRPWRQVDGKKIRVRGYSPVQRSASETNPDQEPGPDNAE